MAVQDLLLDTIAQNVGPLKGTPSGWQKRNCMMCHHRGHSPDKRERFGILYAEGGVTVNCFNCGFGTGWRPNSQLGEKMAEFLMSIGVPESDVKRLRFEAFREATNQIISDEIKLKGNVTSKWKEIDFLKECYSIRFWLEQNCTDRDFLKVVEYANKRGFLDIDKMFWTPSKEDRERKYNRRIVVPYYYKGKIVGFTGRLATDNANKAIPKYMQEMPISYVYGVDEQQDYNKKFIIISEGILDAVITDGIGALHNKLNPDQVAIINSLPGQKILCPDRDKDGDDLIETAIENKWSVAFPHWGRNEYGKPVKDAGEAAEIFGHLLTIKSIIDSREANSYNIRIKRKMDKMNYDY